jgi:hypothetical protein
MYRCLLHRRSIVHCAGAVNGSPPAMATLSQTHRTKTNRDRMMSSTATRQHIAWKRHLLILRKRIVWFLVVFLPVLTPLSTHSKEKQDAASSACVSNLKKIHAAILAYCADHDGYFPPADNWGGLIAPYVDDLKIFTCPAAPPTPGLSWVKVGGVAYPGHYGINQLLHNQDVADKGWCR